LSSHREVRADPREVLADPPCHRVVHREAHTRTLHPIDAHGKRDRHRRRRMDPHSGKQTTSGHATSEVDRRGSGRRSRSSVRLGGTLAVRHVRGALFVDYVRMIRSYKAGRWGELLAVEDLRYLTERIAPDAWYPMATFERMGLAILSEIKPDLDLIRTWG